MPGRCRVPLEEGFDEIAFQRRQLEFAQGNVDVGAHRDLLGLPCGLDDFGAMLLNQRIFGGSDRRART